MPGDIDISVDFSACDAYFAEIADPARVKKITRKALRKGAMVIRDAVAARAPERPELPSGTALPIGALQNDIIVRSSTDDNGREIATVQPGALTNHVAGWVEFGHQLVTGGKLSTSGKGSGHRVGVHAMTSTFVPPHPFFRPAEEASEAAATEAITESLSEDLVSESAPTADTEAA
jgi:HK97 gp10 family phage protein